jgi:hypothetical protein
MLTPDFAFDSPPTARLLPHAPFFRSSLLWRVISVVVRAVRPYSPLAVVQEGKVNDANM